MVQQHQISLIAPYTHQALTSMKTIPKPPDTRGGGAPWLHRVQRKHTIAPSAQCVCLLLALIPLFAFCCLHSVVCTLLLIFLCSSFVWPVNRSPTKTGRHHCLSLHPPSLCGFKQPRGGYDKKPTQTHKETTETHRCHVSPWAPPQSNFVV